MILIYELQHLSITSMAKYISQNFNILMTTHVYQIILMLSEVDVKHITFTNQ